MDLREDDITHPLNRKVIGVDFDGVLAQYDQWRGVDHIGIPRPGSREWLSALLRHFDVVIHTSRSSGRVRRWLKEHKFPSSDHLYVGDEYPYMDHENRAKPPFFMLIDDRAKTFTGDYGEFTPDKILEFKAHGDRR